MSDEKVELSPELADKAHGLICEIVGAWNTGSIVPQEIRGATRQWLVDVADHDREVRAIRAAQTARKTWSKRGPELQDKKSWIDPDEDYPIG